MLETGAAEQFAQGVRGEETKVVGARIKAPLEWAASQRFEGDPEPRMVWRRRQQHSTGNEHALHLAEQLRHVNNVLERFTAPNEIERAIAERQRRALFALDELGARGNRTCAAERLGRSVDADHARTRAYERGAEAAVAAAKVKYALAFDHVSQEQLAALVKALRQRAQRNSGPNIFVPIGHLESAATAQNGGNRLHENAEVERQRPAFDVKEVEVYEVIEVKL